MKKFNNWLAAKSTLVFGTMWMFYAFFIYGLLPLIPAFKPYEEQIFYWSGWVQLWALPLLMVGQIVLGRDSEKRAQQDHEMIMAEFTELKQMHGELQQVNKDLHSKHQRLIDHLEQQINPRVY